MERARDLAAAAKVGWNPPFEWTRIGANASRLSRSRA